MSRFTEKSLAFAFLRDDPPATVRDLIHREPEWWLAFLVEELKIRATRDDGLVSLTYDQQESPMHMPIVRQCRGMVVDVSSGVILAHPYDKFWNLGEPLADQLDWGTARLLDKLDGSLMILYHRGESVERGGWVVASSGHPTAGGNYNGSASKTYREAFWEIFDGNKMRLPREFDVDVCYMFELCAPDNRIVVSYDAPRLVLTGARCVPTGRELNRLELALEATAHDWEIVRSSGYVSSPVSAVLHAADLDPVKLEGFVVVDDKHRRVKVKCPAYVTLHAMRSEFTPRRAVELWRDGEDAGELKAYFPEMGAKAEAIHLAIEAGLRCALLATRALGALDRKEFALRVKDEVWSAVAFRLYNKLPTLDPHRIGGTGELLTLADAIDAARTLTVNALCKMAGIA